jgi:hypothetical protein
MQTVYGQEKPRVFYPRVAAGVNGCQIHGDNSSGFNKAGLFAGTDVIFFYKEKNFFQLGFFYTEKGSRKNINPDNNDYTFYRIHLQYLEVPLTFYRILNKKKYFLSMGFYGAYLIRYTEKNEYGDWTGKYPFKKWEGGVNVGLGKILNSHWIIECRLGNSLFPVREYGLRATGIYYPNPVARIFNRGLYNNIFTIMLYFNLLSSRKEDSNPSQ